MKILIGMPAADSWGGPAACEPPFVDALRKNGIEVETETYVYGDKQTATGTVLRAVRVLRTALRFRRHISEKRFDLVHLNTAFDKRTVLRDAVTVFLMGRNGPPVFLKIHGSAANRIPVRSWLYRRLIRFLDRRVTGYGVFTQEELETFIPHGIKRGKFHIVKNVVRLEHLSRQAFERKQKAAADETELLFVSRFIETKGLMETIRATHLLRERGAGASLTCVGDGPLYDRAVDLVSNLKLEDSVRFTGYVAENEVEEYLARADIFVFPTRHDEGFPIVLFKAAIAGLPIVTTQVRAAAEYFTDGLNSLFCTTDPADIAAKIEQLISDTELRQSMNDANRMFADILTAEKVAAEYLEIYKEIV